MTDMDTSRSRNLLEQEAIAWANKVRKASGTSYTAASRNAAAFILQNANRIEALEAALREVFEEWAGSEGFIPETAPEGYLLQLTKRMADIARAALGVDTV